MFVWLTKAPNRKQIVAIKMITFALFSLPIGRLIYLGIQDNLSANPVEFVERSTGYWALTFLLITLRLTPIRIVTGRVWPLQLRRMLGLFMFFYASLHLLSYIWLDYSFMWNEILKDIIEHPYVLVGSAAFLLSVPLAITSNKNMIKILREHWKTLHKLVYPIAILGVLHFLWLVKKDYREPLLFIFLLILLFGIRLIHVNFKSKK
jgi:methionine sulfoxide reductase heme-binding subunit